MRIIHCAPFNLFTKSGGALYSNAVKLSLGFTRVGNFVHDFDFRDAARYLSLTRSKKNGAKKMNRFFLQQVDEINPDLIVFGHSDLIDVETYEIIKNKKIPMLFWYNDIPAPHYLSNISGYFSAIFATAGGVYLDELTDSSEKTFFFPNPVDISIERYKSFETESCETDILMPARNDAERSVIRNILLKKFADKAIAFPGSEKGNVIIGDQYFKLIENSKIVINSNREYTLKYEWYTSDRLMHILGNGAFALSSRIINGDIFFEDKLEYFDSNEELVEKLEFYLKNDVERNKKTVWLHERVHSLFSSERVARYILDVFNQNARSLKQYEWFYD